MTSAGLDGNQVRVRLCRQPRAGRGRTLTFSPLCAPGLNANHQYGYRFGRRDGNRNQTICVDLVPIPTSDRRRRPVSHYTSSIQAKASNASRA
jgi:hypothetical protein